MKYCPNCGEKIERGKRHPEKGYCRTLCGQVFEICPVCFEFHPWNHTYCSQTGKNIVEAEKEKELKNIFCKKFPVKTLRSILLTAGILGVINLLFWLKGSPWMKQEAHLLSPLFSSPSLFMSTTLYFMYFVSNAVFSMMIFEHVSEKTRGMSFKKFRKENV